MAKVSCILRHRGVQLILAYSCARLAILAGKGRGKCFYFFCFFSSIPFPLSSLTLSFISSTISSISFLPFPGRQLKMIHKGWHVVKPQHNQSVMKWFLLWFFRFHWFKKGICLLLAKVCVQSTGLPLRGLNLLRKSVSRLNDLLDMTFSVLIVPFSPKYNN